MQLKILEQEKELNNKELLLQQKKKEFREEVEDCFSRD